MPWHFPIYIEPLASFLLSLPYLLYTNTSYRNTFFSFLTDLLRLIDYDRPTDRQTGRQHRDFPSERGRTLPHILWHSTWGQRQALQIRSLEYQAEQAEPAEPAQSQQRASREPAAVLDT